MNNLFSRNIKIIYMNNVYKETLGIIEYNPSYNNKFWISFFEILKNCNHKFNELNGRLYLISNQGITSIEKGETIPFDASLIVYSEVTALNNAYRYDEKDGIIFYFHTDENNHLFFPHIHASYSGKEMLISLDSLETTGSLYNRKKEKIAIKYVSQNKSELLEFWNRLIKSR